ncbi:MAG TPA: gliding motility protein GldN [Tenuifilaceae bacterium]|nr:gliding motility protein GldN [Tenuifilaceae bacterium]HPI46144.1 gliding motility protein GldN [Tenuifilaceae bacterium]HPN21334.1 gliding motility protein GldN [Tenuifilaceae bacterium]HPV56129.1 gliding motility protein GldN [Tenuifilaceae bacterium]
MKRLIILFSGISMLACSLSMQAQDRKESLVRDGFYTRETMPARQPIPYPYIRESDVMFSKRVWRVIDLRQKINYPLYFPTQVMLDRESLVQRLIRAIKYNEITAYDSDLDGEFTTRLSYDQVLANLEAVDREEMQMDENGNEVPVTIKGEIKWNSIKELMVKEEWFFDKQRSVMDVRIIGICPIMHSMRILNTGGEEEQAGEITRKQLFWVYFPEARTVLANTDVFNSFNDAQRMSFDDIFFKRRFTSYIIKESNVWDDRRIADYTFGGIQTMQESDRIKNELFDLEHDLWEY